jgi:DNA-binding NtrC family response regulator
MRKAELSSQVFVLLHVVKRIGSMEGRRKVNTESKLVNSGLIGESSPMQLLAREIGTAAGCNLTTLITGESGTGKELVAFALAPAGRSLEHAIHFDHCGAAVSISRASNCIGDDLLDVCGPF